MAKLFGKRVRSNRLPSTVFSSYEDISSNGEETNNLSRVLVADAYTITFYQLKMH